ncbi:sensor histidine kinase [Glycomyces xiaoerkulensis]|uniref:sensor histidine kinase n=1 Tax=Glycomyces xiaoerkulensis TaxID=2038139 RepID=UPI000C257D2F|nr:histidine kinase [Glycomyces xiaoerkulensis]
MTEAIANRWRAQPLVFDVGVALMIGAGTAGATIGATADHAPGLGAFALIGLSTALLAVRRRWPEATLFGTMAVLWVYLALDFPEGPVYVMPAIGVFFYAFARSLKATLFVLALLWVANTVFQAYGLDPDRGPDPLVEATITVVWLAIPATIGRVVREARRARARETAAERERHRADERVAMAREIHDVVGHSLAVVSMNAGVALHMLEKRPEAAAGQVENLRAIRDTSTRALDDLRATLAPLREGQAPELRPAYTIEDIPALVDDVRGGGLPVECAIGGDAAAVPPRPAAAAYRVVQESLTNVIRHAEASRAGVRIDCGAEGLAIEVTDDGRGGEIDPAAAGQGITGMIERVEAHGGTFRAGPGPGGGFAVHAEIPYAGDAD